MPTRNKFSHREIPCRTSLWKLAGTDNLGNYEVVTMVTSSTNCTPFSGTIIDGGIFCGNQEESRIRRGHFSRDDWRGQGRFWPPEEANEYSHTGDGRWTTVPNNCVSGTNRGPGGKTCHLTGGSPNQECSPTASITRRGMGGFGCERSPSET
jgi:hypothetical protein